MAWFRTILLNVVSNIIYQILQFIVTTAYANWSARAKQNSDLDILEKGEEIQTKSSSISGFEGV